jgi:hypothetical protein
MSRRLVTQKLDEVSASPSARRQTNEGHLVEKRDRRRSSRSAPGYRSPGPPRPASNRRPRFSFFSFTCQRTEEPKPLEIPANPAKPAPVPGRRTAEDRPAASPCEKTAKLVHAPDIWIRNSASARSAPIRETTTRSASRPPPDPKGPATEPPAGTTSPQRRRRWPRYRTTKKPCQHRSTKNRHAGKAPEIRADPVSAPGKSVQTVKKIRLVGRTGGDARTAPAEPAGPPPTTGRRRADAGFRPVVRAWRG